MNQKAIEELAVGEVQKYFNLTDLISPYIKHNDKEPEWDGALFLYTSKVHSNDNIYGRISVQIKGHICKVLPKDSIKYRISQTSLKNYMRDGGIVFFVVNMLPDVSETRIFYIDLAPITIRKILRTAKGKSIIAVNLLELPSDRTKVQNLLKDFYDDCNRQISFINKPLLSVEELNRFGYNKVRFHITAKDENDFLSSIATTPVYLYAISDAGVEYPIGEDKIVLQISQEPQELQWGIQVNGRTYFSSCMRQYLEDKIILRAGSCLTIEIPITTNDKENKCLRLNWEGKATTLSERILEYEFILDLYKHLSISIEGHVIRFEHIDIDVHKMEKSLEFYKLLSETLKSIDVKKEFDLSSLSKEDEYKINYLIKTLNKRELQPSDIEMQCLNVNVSNLHLLLFSQKIESGENRITSLFDANIVVANKTDGGEFEMISLFSILSQEEHELYDNIPYNRIIDFYDEALRFNPNVLECANNDLLTMLLAFDKLKIDPDADEKAKDILNAAMRLSEWLLNKVDLPSNLSKEVVLINRLQTIMRHRELTKQERSLLIPISQNHTMAMNIRAAASLLLGNIELFEYQFSKMDYSEQEEFKSFPIYHFRMVTQSK